MGNCCGASADGKVTAASQDHPGPDDSARSPPVRIMDEYTGLVAAPPPAAATDAAASTDEEKLAAATCGKDFSFAGRRFLAKIVDYYDGDTVRVVFLYGGQLVQYKARMAGYDSPEMKPLKSKPNREAEKAAAVAARVALIDKVGDALVYLECGEFDKYGRLLVTVYLRDGCDNGENVNAWMIAHGHGVPYDGGKKTPFTGRLTPGAD